MPRPTTGYKNEAGEKIPSVTTILGRFKESGGLMYWAWQQGTEGKDYREERDAAAEAGRLTHSLVEGHLRGHGRAAIEAEELVASATEEVRSRALRGFKSYLEWQEQTGMEIYSLEEPLVCECHQVGGTPDALGYLDGKWMLLDWKASNAIYQDYLLQLAAYRHLLDNGPMRVHVLGRLKGKVFDDSDEFGGFHLVRFSKENADFSHHFFSELDAAWEMFTHLRAAYELDKALKKRVK